MFSAFHSTVAVRTISNKLIRGVIISDLHSVGAKGPVCLIIKRHHRKHHDQVSGIRVSGICTRIPTAGPSTKCSCRKPARSGPHGISPSNVINLRSGGVAGISVRGIRVICPNNNGPLCTGIKLSRLSGIPRVPGTCPRFSRRGRLPT